jgi:hypothetical protein
MATLSDIKQAGGFDIDFFDIDIMASFINKTPSKVYDYIAQYGGEADSYTRETIFGYIANKFYNDNYDVIYDRWLEGEEV